MRRTGVIFKRQVGSLFRSPLAYVMLTLYLLFSGFFFYHIAFERVNRLKLRAEHGSQPAQVWFEFWRVSGWVLLFIVPIVSMSTIAGEKSSGTLELLVTSPLRLWHLIVGKYLAMIFFLAVMFAPTTLYLWFLHKHGGIGWGEALAGYLGGFLLGTAAFAVGIFISGLTRNNIVAAFATFATLLIFWFIDAAGSNFPHIWRNFVRYFSLYVHYQELVSANIGLHDIMYLTSFALFFLYLSIASVHILWSRGRWV